MVGITTSRNPKLHISYLPCLHALDTPLFVFPFRFSDQAHHNDRVRQRSKRSSTCCCRNILDLIRSRLLIDCAWILEPSMLLQAWIAMYPPRNSAPIPRPWKAKRCHKMIQITIWQNANTCTVDTTRKTLEHAVTFDLCFLGLHERAPNWPQAANRSRNQRRRAPLECSCHSATTADDRLLDQFCRPASSQMADPAKLAGDRKHVGIPTPAQSTTINIFAPTASWPCDLVFPANTSIRRNVTHADRNSRIFSS